MWYLITLIARRIVDLFTCDKQVDAADLQEEVPAEEVTIEEKKQKYFWIIDPGHGKLTKGKRSPKSPDGRQLLEYEFNHEIAALIVEALDARGIKYLLTIDNPDKHGNALGFRVKKANNFDTQLPKIYVSIHGNAGPGEGFNKAFRGIETYYFSPLGKRIADIFQTKLIEATGLKHRGIKKNGFFVLKYTDHPAILTENGFFNNPDEFELMLTHGFRKQIADAHVKAILQIEENGL